MAGSQFAAAGCGPGHAGFLFWVSFNFVMFLESNGKPDVLADVVACVCLDLFICRLTSVVCVKVHLRQ